MSNKEKVLFNRPREVHVTRSINITFLQSSNCDVTDYLNNLECRLCGNIMGTLRPLGIAWGTMPYSNQKRGIRLCNTCYILAKEGDGI